MYTLHKQVHSYDFTQHNVCDYRLTSEATVTAAEVPVYLLLSAVRAESVLMEGASLKVSPVAMDTNSVTPGGNETPHEGCSGLAYCWLTVSIVCVSLIIRSTGILYLLLARQPAGTDKGQRSTSHPTNDVISHSLPYSVV